MTNKEKANVMVNRIWSDMIALVTGKHRDAYEQALNEAEKRGMERAADRLMLRSIEESLVNEKLGNIIEQLSKEIRKAIKELDANKT